MTAQTKKIVCIEDDTFLLDLIKDKFADAGIVAIPAHTGAEGVALAAQEDRKSVV